MRSVRLRYRFAPRGYARQRWPAGRAIMPTQLCAQMHQLSLYECCLMAGLSRPKVSRQKSGISHQAIRMICKKQAKLMARNAYHNKAHVGQVIIACGLLADEANIGQVERDILLLAALIHDYHHLGAMRNMTAFWQELLSCHKAIPQLVRGGLDSRLIGLLYEMILATSPQAQETDNALRGNDILSLLCDADLYGSLFLSRADVDRLTANLKYEDRLSVPLHQLRDGFLAKCQQKGFASLAGQMLHDRLKAGMTYG